MVITSVVGAALIQFAGAVTPGPLIQLPIDNPLGLTGPAGTVATVAFGVGLVLHWGSLPARGGLRGAALPPCPRR